MSTRPSTVKHLNRKTHSPTQANQHLQTGELLFQNQTLTRARNKIGQSGGLCSLQRSMHKDFAPQPHIPDDSIFAATTSELDQEQKRAFVSNQMDATIF